MLIGEDRLAHNLATVIGDAAFRLMAFLRILKEWKMN